jgi:hypothetical protein
MKSRKHETDTEMLPEYDFGDKKGVRGKYYKAYQQGHTVKIHQTDGSTITQHYTLEDGAVLLAPDVRKHFPDAESVNRALRVLIGAIPDKKPQRPKLQKNAGTKTNEG